MICIIIQFKQTCEGGYCKLSWRFFCLCIYILCPKYVLPVGLKILAAISWSLFKRSIWFSKNNSSVSFVKEPNKVFKTIFFSSFSCISALGDTLCRSYGGHLARLETREEIEMISRYLTDVAPDCQGIGDRCKKIRMMMKRIIFIILNGII